MLLVRNDKNDNSNEKRKTHLANNTDRCRINNSIGVYATGYTEGPVYTGTFWLTLYTMGGRIGIYPVCYADCYWDISSLTNIQGGKK